MNRIYELANRLNDWMERHAKLTVGITFAVLVLIALLMASCAPVPLPISGSWVLLYDYTGCDGWYDGQATCTFIGDQFVCGTISGSAKWRGEVLSLYFENGSVYDGYFLEDGTLSGVMLSEGGESGCWVMEGLSQ